MYLPSTADFPTEMLNIQEGSTAKSSTVNFAVQTIKMNAILYQVF
jgi:hypothetical protein